MDWKPITDLYALQLTGYIASTFVWWYSNEITRTVVFACRMYTQSLRQISIADPWSILSCLNALRKQICLVQHDICNRCRNLCVDCQPSMSSFNADWWYDLQSWTRPKGSNLSIDPSAHLHILRSCLYRHSRARQLRWVIVYVPNCPV